MQWGVYIPVFTCGGQDKLCAKKAQWILIFTGVCANAIKIKTITIIMNMMVSWTALKITTCTPPIQVDQVKLAGL